MIPTKFNSLIYLFEARCTMMIPKLLRSRKAALLMSLSLMLGNLMLTPSVCLAQAPTKLVTRMLQNEPLRIPIENTALFSTSVPSINVDVAYLADLTGPDETMLTLVTPDNQIQDLERGDDGQFTIPNPVEGLYAIIARTAGSLATIPFYAKGIVEPANLPDLVSDISDQDNTVVVPVIENSRDVVEDLSEQYVAFREPAPITPEQYDFQPLRRYGYQVRMSPDGLVSGQIIIPTQDPQNRNLLTDNNLFLIRNGVRIANELSDGTGEFAFKNTTPGIYGLVAAGPAGYTAFRFEVLPSEAITRRDANALSDAGYVLQQIAEAASVLPVCMIPPDQAVTIIQIQRSDREMIVDAPLPMDSGATPLAGTASPSFGGAPAGGGGGFGGGGGGFGGGGFGGVGALGALAGIGGVIAATTGDDDDNVNFQAVPQAASTASPLP